MRVGHRVLDIEAASRVKGEPLPSTIKALLAAGRGALSRVQALSKAAVTEARSFSHAMHEERAIRLLPPVPDADRFLCAGADEPEGTRPKRAGSSRASSATTRRWRARAAWRGWIAPRCSSSWSAAAASA